MESTLRRILVLVGVMAMVFAMMSPSFAITRGGSLDGNDHPMVALMVATDAAGTPLWRCSGTFISETVYVTAGHCTESPAARAEIWLASDVESGIPGNGYPFTGDVSGVAHTYPQYNPNAFWFADLGVVVLDGGDTVAGPYASLPAQDVVDGIGKGRNEAVVTAVGYGLQQVRSNPAGPNFTIADRVRYQADLFIVDREGVAGIGSVPGTRSMVLSGDSKHGGTCFGDSGGPSFLHDTTTLVAVTSFGLNGNCAGIGGVYRIDGEAELAWINGFLP